MKSPAAGDFSCCRRARWIPLAAACVLAMGAQAVSATDADQQSASILLQRAQNEIGRRQADLPRALEQIQRGMARTRGDPIQHAKWLELLWYYFLLHDDHARARDAVEEARRLLTAAKADPELIADVTISLAYSLILVGEVGQAKEYLRRAIVMATPLGKRELRADLYFSLADAYRKTGEPLVARRYFELAREIDRSLPDRSEEAITDIKLGTLARDAGDHAEAVRLHTDAMKQFRADGSYRKIVAAIELARDYAAQGQFDRSRQLIDVEVLRDGRALPEQRIDANILLLRIANEMSEAGGEAPANARAAAALIRQIESLLAASAVRQQSVLARPTHQLQFFEQVIRRHAIDGDAEKMQARGNEMIHLVRRVAHDLQASSDDSLAWLAEAQPAFNQYVRAVYKLDRERVLPLLETYYDHSIDSTGIRHSGVIGRAFEAEAVEVFDRYVAAERALVDTTEHDPGLLNRRLKERDLARDSYLATRQAPPLTRLPRLPSAIESRRIPVVPAGDVVIRYFVQEQISFGVALSQAGLVYFDLPPRSIVVKQVQRALHAVQVLGRTNQAARRLALAELRSLLPPGFLDRYPTATRLIVVADDAVQPLPFGAIDLSDEPHAYQPLLSRFEIVRAKSVSRYYAKQPRNTGRDLAAPATSDLVVFAAPDLEVPLAIESAVSRVSLDANASAAWPGQLRDLPNARKEADAIANEVPGRSVRLLVGRDARSEALLSADVRSARVLHIATHGYFNEATPDIVGFATAGASGDGRSELGFLGLTELFTAPFSSRLVVISGCETMRGRDYSGWGVRSLADGFLSGGAGSAIGTLWSIPDRTTAELMTVFYRTLQETRGNSSAALRRAQLAQFESLRAEPYFWAAFVLESANRRFDRHAF